MARTMLDVDPRDPGATRKAARSKTKATHPRTGKKLGNGPRDTDPAAVQSMQQRWRSTRGTKKISDFAGVERNPNPKQDYVQSGRDLIEKLGPNRVPKGTAFKDPSTGEILKGGRRLPEGFKVQATRSGQVRVVRNGSVPVQSLRPGFMGKGGKFTEATGFRVVDEEAFEKAVKREADSWVPGGEASSRQVQILLDAAKDDLLSE